MKPQQHKTWVVYTFVPQGKSDAVNAVCEASEWATIQLERPGYYRLIKAGITSEAEAEILARGTAGDARKSPYAKCRS